MKELSERKDIIINKANKVGATFIVAVKEYIKAGQQPHNTNNYKKLHEDPTTTNMKLLTYAKERFKKQKLINQKVAEGLKRNDSITLKSHLRPKIHKEGSTGRPVVSSVNFHTANISKYVSYHFNP